MQATQAVREREMEQASEKWEISLRTRRHSWSCKECQGVGYLRSFSLDGVCGVR